MSKASRKGNKQKTGSSRKNYFSARTKYMKQGSKGKARYEQSLARNKSKG